MRVFIAPAVLPFHYGICEPNRLGFLCEMNVYREKLSDDVGWLSVKCDRGKAVRDHSKYFDPLVVLLR